MDYKLRKYKKNTISKTQKLILSFILVLLTLGVVYAALVSDLSILGNLVVKKYVVPRTKTFPSQIEQVLDDELCSARYEDAVTDEVNNTIDNAKNVYFFKCSNKRNIIFNNMCWQVIRTTETGGIKMIYNGEPVNGKCESSRGDHTGIVGENGSSQILDGSYLYGDSFTYDMTNSTFTLTDTTTATWSDSTYENLLGKFTCKNTTGTCTTLYNVNGYSNSTTAYTSSYTIGNTNYAQIGTSPFNANSYSASMIGYMFNKSYNYKSKSPGTTEYKYGNTFTYNSNTHTYTLSGTTQNISNWSSGYNQLNNTHYTCWNTTGNCTTIYYIYFTSASYCFYLELSNGKSINDAINEMVTNDDINKYDSSIKGITDAWYRQNVLNKTNMIEDTVYCNARNITSVGAFNKDGGSTDPGSTHYLQLKNYNLSNSLVCPNNTDQFAISNNKARLTFPVALLQDEERVNIDTNSLMATGTCWWSLSPTYFNANNAGVRNISADGSNLGDVDYVNNTQGTRPSISLKNGITISSGDGSETSPWIVDETSLNTTIGTYNTRLKNTYLSDTYRNKIKTLTLSDSINIPNNAVISWDIGSNQNNKVMAYLMTNASDNTMYDLYIQGDGELKANYDSSYLFSNMPNLTTINNLTILDTSNTNSMKDMFAASTSLTSIDISHFDTSNVTNFDSMFSGVDIEDNQVTMNLSTITGLSTLNTSNVTNMRRLFMNCGKMNTIDLSGFDTRNVTDMQDMFNNVNDQSSLLTTIVFGNNFDTGKVTNMTLMFADNPLLANIDVSHFNTSNVTSMRQMFSNVRSIINLNLSNFDTGNVVNFRGMFTNMTNLTTLNVSSFNTIKATDMYAMFYDLPNLTSLDVSSFDTTNVKNMYGMFYNCNKLTALNVSNFNTGNVTNMSNMFYNCRSLTSLDVSDFDVSKVESIAYMFQNCINLQSLDVSRWQTSSVTNMAGVFMMYDQENDAYIPSPLTTINVSGWDTSHVINFRNMFLGSSVNSLNLSNWTTSSATEMGNMFAMCKNLTSLDLSSFNTNNVTSMWHMFTSSSNIKTLKLSNFSFSNVTDSTAIFANLPTKANGMKVYVKNTTARTWILNLVSPNRPADWDTSNILIAS